MKENFEYSFFEKYENLNDNKTFFLSSEVFSKSDKFRWKENVFCVENVSLFNISIENRKIGMRIKHNYLGVETWFSIYEFCQFLGVSDKFYLENLFFREMKYENGRYCLNLHLLAVTKI